MATPSESSPLLQTEPSTERTRPNLTNRPSSGARKTLRQFLPPVPPNPPPPAPGRDEYASSRSSHTEKHTDYNDLLRDVIIGFSDGLTVPFALTAGLSSLGSARLVIMGGLAELFSGMISMGLGAYLAAVTERDHYRSERRREEWEVAHLPTEEREEVFAIVGCYGVSRAAATPLVEELCRDPKQWVRFMMDFELRLEDPEASRAWLSALTMGLSYFVGGLIPMIPYFVMDRAQDALLVSIAITVVILLAFGYGKNYVTIRTHRAGLWGAVQTLVIGMLAAGTSYLIVRALDTKHH